MALDQKEVTGPFAKLRKQLGKLPRRPSPGEVHKLRTRTRRIEAVLQAFRLSDRTKGGELLEHISGLRKGAGKVRDMDVLTGFAASLPVHQHRECLVALLEQLGLRRAEAARRLHKTVRGARKPARHALQRCCRRIGRELKSGNSEWASDAAAVALQLSGELANWPKPTAANLHEFRLKTKQLRYTLKLSGDKAPLLSFSGEAKDRIGEWHDWHELAAIARKAIGHGGRCEVLDLIQSGEKKRLERALWAANRLRAQYFKPQGRGYKLGPRVIKVTAGLAA
ncbi:MAG: CHAD domain-containing protein [Acidobacteria bacterium]|nr:CHAD domain-containing protein [Acidobacteriota bacterium]